MNRYVVVTGTDTGVGKTVATAALAVRLRRAGHRVHIRKPAQTGLVADTDPRRSALEASYTDVVTQGDAEIAGRLSGAPASTAVSLTLPMAPGAAAEHEGVDLPTPRDHAEAIVALARRLTEEAGMGEATSGAAAVGPGRPEPSAHGDSVILVEGAGGLLVDLGGGGTLADIAAELADLDPAAGLAVIVVVRSGLGTLNHTALTCEALRTRGLPVSGIVLGAWPGDPAPVEVDNRRRLGECGPVIGAVPDGAGGLDPEAFAAAAPDWTTFD